MQNRNMKEYKNVKAKNPYQKACGDMPRTRSSSFMWLSFSATSRAAIEPASGRNEKREMRAIPIGIQTDITIWVSESRHSTDFTFG